MRTITLTGVLSWIFGIIFLITGVSTIGQGSYIIGILIVLCSAMIIPYFNKVIAEKLDIKISGGIKFALVIIILILVGFAMSKSPSSTVEIQPTSEVKQSSQSQQTEIPKPKVKSASLNIDRIVVTVGNLDDTRITITNTGDVSITPKFDVTVTDNNDKVTCEGSPFFGMGSISAGEKKTDEIQILGCMFTKDGTYTLKVDLLDKDYNKLDSKSKDFEVSYWNKFNF